MATLLLFDIDGTVLDSARSGRNSLKEAISSITGIDPSNALDFSFMGKTDRYIIKKILGNLYIPCNESIITDIKQEYFKILKFNIANNPNKMPIPGIKSFLDYLKGMQGIHIGLQTGNFKEGAYIKLCSLKLDTFFQVGGFGDTFTDRTDVIKQAIAESELYFNTPFSNNSVIVIGDTPADILSGKKLNTRTIAICSNPEMNDVLRNSSPGLMVSDFCNKDILYSYIKNGTKHEYSM